MATIGPKRGRERQVWLARRSKCGAREAGSPGDGDSSLPDAEAASRRVETTRSRGGPVGARLVLPRRDADSGFDAINGKTTRLLFSTLIVLRVVSLIS